MNISELILAIQQSFGTYLATFIMWSFLMAFLFNLVKRSSLVHTDKTLMWISLAIFLSYLMTDPLVSMAFEIKFLESASGFFLWCFLDLACLFIILFVTRGSSIEDYPAKLYVIVGLLINSTLFFFLYIDVDVNGNDERWFLWDLYTVTVNLMDITMLVALLTNKDFFKFVALFKLVRRRLFKVNIECLN